MTTQSGGEATEQKLAAERIEEARQLQRNINRTLKAVLDLVESGDLGEIDKLPKQMAQLNNVFAETRKKEAEFNGQFGTGLADGDIDFDAVRYQIGCRLRRIRKCCRSQGVPQKPDAD
ncbi:hypothetical protein [Pseudooctadecabacter jejudonensis]|uniref:Uncharacterized protein n=1 Tax=Pseudooctadecabacter jejudonensis TaxID=1391910 RepID=A0A1Y5TB12_9RHOB|nr:hypothetical protein [Pseudooctadecabacter jejudonensis]SLN59666.1 hypothetical protein PSJ8397_03174 [Pseudooctadecabacter jejudonensis]